MKPASGFFTTKGFYPNLVGQERLPIREKCMEQLFSHALWLWMKMISRYLTLPIQG